MLRWNKNLNGCAKAVRCLGDCWSVQYLDASLWHQKDFGDRRPELCIDIPPGLVILLLPWWFWRGFLISCICSGYLLPHTNILLQIDIHIDTGLET